MGTKRGAYDFPKNTSNSVWQIQHIWNEGRKGQTEKLRIQRQKIEFLSTN